MKFNFAFLITSLYIITSCTHHPENVEIVYKSPNREGYKQSLSSDNNLSINNTSYKKVYVNEDEELYELKTLENKTEPSIELTTQPVVLQSKSTNTNLSDFHIVIAGDTYYSIARLYNLNPKELMSWNNYQDGDKLSINQKVIIHPKNTLSVEKSNSNALYIKRSSDINPQIVQNTAPKPVPVQASVVAPAPSYNSKCKDKFSFPTKERRIIIDFEQIQSGGVISDGITFIVNNEEEVRASNDGEVAYVGNDVADYGNIIILKHKDNYFSIYGYLKSINLREGSYVKKGDFISYTSVKDKKFYFAIRKGKTPIRPIFCV